MRKAALLAAGALALPLVVSLPATAQQSQNAKPPQQTGQQQPMPQSGKNNPQQSRNNAQNEQQNGQAAQLNQGQIKQVQQALDQKGFKAGHQDGRLGKQTRQALSKFQKSKNLQQTGQPDDQTLQALGINMNGSTNGAATTGAAPSGQSPSMDQNPPPANNSGGSANSNGQK